MNLAVVLGLLTVAAGFVDGIDTPRRRSFDRDIDCGYPPAPGPCNKYLDMYYYESHEKRCKLFQYGGCGGNTNFFWTMTECQRMCTGSKAKPYETTPKPTTTTAQTTTTKYPGLEARCNLELHGGDCTATSANVVRYYYDVYTGQCSRFVYCVGGGGNENRFDAIDICRAHCVTGTTQSSLSSTQSTASRGINTRPPTPLTTPFPLFYYELVANEGDCHDATTLRTYLFTWIGDCALTCDRYRPRCNAFGYNRKTFICRLLTRCKVRVISTTTTPAASTTVVPAGESTSTTPSPTLTGFEYWQRKPDVAPDFISQL